METLNKHSIYCEHYNYTGKIEYRITSTDLSIIKTQPTKYVLENGNTVKKENIGVVMGGIYNNNDGFINFVVWGLTKEEAVPLLVNALKTLLANKLETIKKLVDFVDQNEYEYKHRDSN